MSPIYFRVDNFKNLVLKGNETRGYLLLDEFPLKLPFDYKKLVDGWIASGEELKGNEKRDIRNKSQEYKSKQEIILSFAEQRFRQSNIFPGSKRHIVGQIYSLCEIINEENDGIVAMEALVKRGKYNWRPDVIGLNGRVKFVEVESGGFIKPKKFDVLKDLKKINKSEVIVTIPKNEECINNLVTSFKRYDSLEACIDKIWLASPNLFNLLKGKLPEEYTTNEFLKEFGT